MPRDLFQEQNISIESSGGRDLFTENNIEFDEPQQEAGAKSLGDFEKRLAPNVLASLGRSGEDLLHALAGLMGRKNLPEKTDFNKLLGIEDQGISDQVTQLLPELLTSMAVPTSAGIKVAGKSVPYITPLSKVLSESVKQGGIAALFNPQDAANSSLLAGGVTGLGAGASEIAGSKSKAARNLARAIQATLGGGLGYTVGESTGLEHGIPTLTTLIGALLGGRGNLRDKASVIKEAMEKKPEYKEILEAGRRQGIDLRPAEVLQTPKIASMQGVLERNPTSQDIMYDSGQQRLKQEEKAIRSFYDQIFDPSRSSEIDALYKIANPVRVPEEYKFKYEGKPTRSKYVENKEGKRIAKEDLFEEKPGQNFVETPEGDIILKKDLVEESTGKVRGGKTIFKEAKEQLENDKAYKDYLKGTPKNSIKYYNEVKRKLDAMVLAEKDPTARKRIKDVRAAMRKDLDKYSDEYAQARKLSEAQKTREKVDGLLNDADIRGSNFYQKIKNDKLYDELVFRLRDNEDALKKLEDLRLIGKDLLNPPTIKTARGSAKSGADETRNSAKKLYDDLSSSFINYITKSNDAKDLAEFMVNPNWDKDIKKLLELTGKEKLLNKLLSTSGKASGQASAKVTSEQD